MAFIFFFFPLGVGWNFFFLGGGGGGEEGVT